MSILPVHCCCTPTTRLGFVPVKRLPMGVAMFQVLDAKGGVERVIVTSIGQVYSSVPTLGDDHVMTTERHQTEAVKSAHEPIEVWRRVKGFVEDQGQWPESNPDHAKR